MRAVTIVDQTLQLVEHPDPDPGPGEVVLAVRAAGLNPADALQVFGYSDGKCVAHPAGRATTK